MVGGGWCRVIDGELFFSAETNGVELLRVLWPMTLITDGSKTRSGGWCSRLAANGSWLDSDEQRRVVKSRVRAGAIVEAEGESECEEERLEEDFSIATMHEGIRSCPSGTAVTGGVRSPSHYRTWCNTRAGDQREPLSGGCG
jgi:hypothetical protein